MSAANVSLETRLLAALVRIGDAPTIARLVRLLDRNGGDVTRTTAELGIAYRTWTLWTHQSPAFAKALAGHVRRRSGGVPVGQPTIGERVLAAATDWVRVQEIADATGLDLRATVQPVVSKLVARGLLDRRGEPRAHEYRAAPGASERELPRGRARVAQGAGSSPRSGQAQGQAPRHRASQARDKAGSQGQAGAHPKGQASPRGRQGAPKGKAVRAQGEAPRAKTGQAKQAQTPKAGQAIPTKKRPSGGRLPRSKAG